MEFARQALTRITGFNQDNLFTSIKGSLFYSSWGFSQSHLGISRLNLAYSRGLMNNLYLLSSLTNYFSPKGLSTLVIKDPQWFRFYELVKCVTLVVTESPTDMHSVRPLLSTRKKAKSKALIDKNRLKWIESKQVVILATRFQTL